MLRSYFLVSEFIAQPSKGKGKMFWLEKEHVAHDHQPLKYWDIHVIFDGEMENDSKGDHPVAKLLNPDQGKECTFNTECPPGQKVDGPSVLKHERQGQPL